MADGREEREEERKRREQEAIRALLPVLGSVGLAIRSAGSTPSLSVRRMGIASRLGTKFARLIFYNQCTTSSLRLARFRAWFEALDAQQFDAAIERDAQAGKLDALPTKRLRRTAPGVRASCKSLRFRTCTMSP